MGFLNHKVLGYIPKITTILGIWISPDFTIKITTWIEEWKKLEVENENIFNSSLCELIVSKSDLKEQEIQEKMSKELNGIKELKTPVGFIDLLTKDKIIEIKEFTNWKCALGQILSYGEFYPEQQKIIVLFGDLDPDLLDPIKNIYEKFGIQLQIV